MKKYLLIFSICFLPRFIYLFTQLKIDPSWSFHWAFSENLLRYGVLGYEHLRSTAVDPLYPIFLAGARWVSGDRLILVLLIQITVAAVGCIYFYRLSLALSKTETVALVASSLYSFYPYLIHESVTIIEVPLFMTLLIASAYYYLQATPVRGSLVCGAVFGLTVLARSMIVPAIGLGVIALALKKQGLNAGLVAGTFILVTLPFFLRNYQIDGSFVPTRSGWNLLEGNCKYSDKFLPHYPLDLLDPYTIELLDKEKPELAIATGEKAGREVDTFFTRKALEFVRQNPIRTLRLKLLNVVYLFYPRIVPFYTMNDKTRVVFREGEGFEVHRAVSRKFLFELAHSVSYSLILLTAPVGVFLRRKEVKNDLILFFIVSTFVVIYSIYWPGTRVRVPMDFILMFYSACALTRFISTHRVFAWIKVQRLV